MKQRGLLIYTIFALLVANEDMFNFKENVTIPIRMQNRITTQEKKAEVDAYIRYRTMLILNKYYNMEKSDIHVNFEGRVKMVGEKKVVAADWVYKKYGILNPRPTFTRITNEMGDKMYRIDCHPDWEEDVIFAPIDFTSITVKLKVPLHKKMVKPILIGSILVMSIFLSPVVLFALGRSSSVFNSFKYEDFTQIINAKDHGIIGDGVADETNALETLFTDYAGRVIFFPRGTYDVDQYDTRTAGGYSDVMGPGILADTTLVGEGEGTEFVALANALYMFYLSSNNNITIKDCKFTGTGVAGAGDLSSSAFYGQNCDNLHIINVTSNDMIGGGGLNSRGITMIGTQVGSLVQDCRMDGNQHSLVIGAPDDVRGLRVISCYSNDAVEKNYYFENIQIGISMMSNVADGTGDGIYAYCTATHKGTSFSGNAMLCDGSGLIPYQGTTYTHFNVTWSNNIAQTGANGCYAQCAMTTFVGNILTFNTNNGFYSFVRFTDNTVNNNVMSKNTDYGLYLHNDSDNNEYVGNQIIDNSGIYGIWHRDGDNNRFIGNNVYSSDTGSYHTTYGLYIQGGTYPYLRDNDLRSAGTTIYNDNITTTIWASGNLTEAWA